MLRFGYASLLAAALVSLGAASAPAEQDGWEINAYLGGELRVFPDDPKWPIQDGNTFYPSLYAQVDMTYDWDGERQQIHIKPYGRYDFSDHRRSHADLRELNYSYKGDGWDALIGAHVVFWGRAESRHLVNVINQIDYVENFDGESYLGQPMFNLNFTGDHGKFSLFVMSGFRNQTFAANDGRLSGGVMVAAYDPLFECQAEEWCFDFAGRYENSFGPVDLGISYFHGTNREPIFTVFGGEFAPFYQRMDQIGVDGAYAIDDLILKLEAIYRFNAENPFVVGERDHFFAATFGGEYTWKDPFDGGYDLGLLVEYNWDDRDFGHPITIFDNDVFAGLRFTWNDETDTHALIGVQVDTRNSSSYVYLEASRRLGDDWRLGVEARIFTGNDLDPLQAIDHDSYVQAKLTKYFSLTD
jgi:hypothetical protein